MAKDVTLTDKDNEKIYPKTYMKNVYDSSGQKTLEDKMVTTDTWQNITANKDFTGTLTLHNKDTSTTATYKAPIGQTGDKIYINRTNETNSSDKASVVVIDLANKTLSVGGKKVASVENGMYLQGSNISVSFSAGDYAAGTTTTLISSAPANGWYTASVNVTGNSWFSCAGYSYRPQAVNGGYSIQLLIPVPKGSKLTFYASAATTVKNVYLSTFIQSKET